MCILTLSFYACIHVVEYADLAIIDLSKVSTPEGRATLANEVRDALNTTGFFYVINHGFTQEETDRMFDIANVPFSQVSDEKKQAYLGKIKETGTFQGYKLRNYWVTYLTSALFFKYADVNYTQ